MSLVSHYKLANKSRWQGRVDPDKNSLRLHQVIKFLDIRELRVGQVAATQPLCSPKENKKFALIGFCCDEGIQRNQGRPGARGGPDAIRNALTNLPVHFNEQGSQIFDAGDILYQKALPTHDSLLSTQFALSTSIQILLFNQFFPIVLGGGHEVAFGHYHGIHFFLKSQKQAKFNEDVGIINFDAHFDMRALEKNHGTSGTPFLQIAKLSRQEPFQYLCLGIQKASNTKKLFQTAEELGAKFIFAEEINQQLPEIMTIIDTFIQKNKFIYLTVCLDVFDSAFAPGVSAPASNGLTPHCFFPLLHKIMNSNKVIGFDIAEMSPGFDVDQHTAKLASLVLFNVFSNG